jgi:hypothetical protein
MAKVKLSKLSSEELDELYNEILLEKLRRQNNFQNLDAILFILEKAFKDTKCPFYRSKEANEYIKLFLMPLLPDIDTAKILIPSLVAVAKRDYKYTGFSYINFATKCYPNFNSWLQELAPSIYE